MQSSVATKKQFKRPGARVRASFTLENVNIYFHVTGEEIEAECSARFQLTFVPGLGKNICRKEKLKRSYPPDDIRRLRAVKKMLGDS